MGVSATARAVISIHAPRVGSDWFRDGVNAAIGNFNPRSPCGERPFSGLFLCRLDMGFQSTLPVWGATGSSKIAATIIRFQSTLPVWGATGWQDRTTPHVIFQSTLPVWGATAGARGLICPLHISIHAPRVGSDRCAQPIPAIRADFNPRSPCGERRSYWRLCCAWPEFQSTLPVWGATKGAAEMATAIRISIHAPRVGSDWLCNIRCAESTIFQSTLPVWGATAAISSAGRFLIFQSTLPVWGATINAPTFPTLPDDFNPRSPCGERLMRNTFPSRNLLFQSTLPVWGATLCNILWVESTIFQSTLPVWGATLRRVS